MKVWDRLNLWAFGYGSPVALGVFRIILGGLTVLSLLITALGFINFYSEHGYVPWELTQQYMGNQARLTLIPFPASDVVLGVFYAVVTLAAVTTALGLWTRPSTILLALGMVTLHHRNPLILHSGDSLMRLCLIYLSVSPCGAACSLDKLRTDKKAGQDTAKQVPLFGQRLIQFQIAVVYGTTFWHKMYGDFWRDGTATYYPAHLSEFDRFPLPAFLDNHPTIVWISTYGTLATEIALATLVFWKPARKWVLLAGLLMHAYIEYRFNIPLFSFIICSTYICFYSGEEVSAWWIKLRAKPSVAQVHP